MTNIDSFAKVFVPPIDNGMERENERGLGTDQVSRPFSTVYWMILSIIRLNLRNFEKQYSLMSDLTYERCGISPGLIRTYLFRNVCCADTRQDRS